MSLPIGSSGAINAGKWISVDVTSQVVGNGLVSFGLFTTSSTNIALASRETGANAPQLVVKTQVVPTTSTAITYTYDALYRLTNANYTGTYTYSFTYGYDAVGNRTVQTRTITNTQA